AGWLTRGADGRSNGDRLVASEASGADGVGHPAELGVDLAQRRGELGKMIGERRVVPPGDVDLTQSADCGTEPEKSLVRTHVRILTGLITGRQPDSPRSHSFGDTSFASPSSPASVRQVGVIAARSTPAQPPDRVGSGNAPSARAP